MDGWTNGKVSGLVEEWLGAWMGRWIKEALLFTQRDGCAF